MKTRSGKRVLSLLGKSLPSPLFFLNGFLALRSNYQVIGTVCPDFDFEDLTSTSNAVVETRDSCADAGADACPTCSVVFLTT